MTIRTKIFAQPRRPAALRGGGNKAARRASLPAGLILAGAALVLAPAAASAQATPQAPAYGFQPGDVVFTLSGTGVNDRDFDTGSAGVSGSLSYFVTNGLEVGLRQSVTWADTGPGADAWNGATRLALDYNFDLGRFRPFVGASIGAVYGDATRDSGIIGPEAGVKYFVNPTTFVFGMTEYQYFFNRSTDIGNNFDRGSWAHSIGLGVRF